MGTVIVEPTVIYKSYLLLTLYCATVPVLGMGAHVSIKIQVWQEIHGLMSRADTKGTCIHLLTRDLWRHL